MRKRNIIIGIIIFSIITVCILAISPVLIESKVKSNSQWIAFYASYLGGIFGGVVSGSLTLGGVYLTIRHQNKLLNQEKIAKIDYVLGELKHGFWTLDKYVKDTYEWPSDSIQIKYIKQYAATFLKDINDNKHIIETDFKLLKHIEATSRALNSMVDYSSNRPDDEIMEEFKMHNEYIQLRYEKLQEYDKSLH